MAHLSTCRYCERQCLDSEYHPDCRIEFLEGLLRRIQSHIKRTPNRPLPDSLRKIIRQEHFEKPKGLKANDQAASKQGAGISFAEIQKSAVGRDVTAQRRSRKSR